MTDSPLSPETAGTPLGRVVATERKPNTPHEFHFWTALDSPVGIGTIVRVEGALPVNGQIPTIYGIVVEGFSYTDLQTPIHDMLGHDGTPGGASFGATQRAEIRLYTAAVLRQLPEEPLQPVPMGRVFLADNDDVAVALRMDGYLRDGTNTGIPIGVYRAGGTDAPIYLDADFLIGPEAAHLNITGVSGLATKTSAIEWILSSIFTHFPAQKGSVAAVCFNVKGPDLCFLDQPGPVDEADAALYEKCGVPVKPFEHVQYFAPYKADGYSLNTLRSNDALLHNVSSLTWGLREVLQYAEVLLNKDDVDAKADALIDFIRERIVDRDFSDPLLGNKRYLVRSFADLEQWFRDVLSGLEGKNSDGWRTQVYVIDVASLEEDAQDLIFARVVTRLREHLEKRDLGVNHVVVFVDELNKYAPNDGPETYVRKMLLDLAERGRYLGLVLFSAQQFRSQVHRRVVGNSGTALYGRMDADELATPGYAVLSPAVKIKLATLEKGQLMVRHPHFTQPIFVRFPRPAVLRGRDGAERYPQAVDIDLEAAVVRSLRTLDPTITLGWVQQAVGIREEDEIVRARNATMRERPGDVRKFFLSQLRPVVAAQTVARPTTAAVRSAPADDPYGF